MPVAKPRKNRSKENKVLPRLERPRLRKRF